MAVLLHWWKKPGTSVGIKKTGLLGYFGGSLNNDLSLAWSFNGGITSIGPGLFQITFAAPHPDGSDYVAHATPHEDAGPRDIRKASVIEATKTALGYQVLTTVDDNGGAADIPASIGFETSASWRCDVVTETQRDGQITDVDRSRDAALFIGPADIHNALPVVAFVGDDLDAGWSRVANVVSFTGQAKKVRGTVNINAPDSGVSNYWSRPKLRVTEATTGKTFIMDDLVMQQNTAYDGDATFQGSFVHKGPLTNPSYTFEWFDKDNRTATLIPIADSQIVLEAVQSVQVLEVI